ncbi:hypothetical protein [Kitasatospora cineracea]|uniref:Uncharacterized protein n=1 Tax=Kitasatospora cineracea TaxID=88074 RepID=A0A3N4RJU9_9ACTN|nr:hypothetical protein [Kitasatospora cineracea]RPE27310.1 hypothetical protein EDD38_7455 [Kitasatospora cineracea]
MSHDHDSVYNDPSYNITSIPTWQTTPAPAPPLHGAYAPNARLSTRAKAALGVGGAVLAASGMFAWSNYQSTQADAEVRKAQLALDAQRLDLQRQQQNAEQAAQAAAAAGHESEAQRSRREAVQACIDKAGQAITAVDDCGKAYPAIDPVTGMVNTAQNVAATNTPQGSQTPTAGLWVLGGVGAVLAFGYARKWAATKFHQ